MRARLALFLALAVVLAGLLPSLVPAAPKAGGILKLAHVEQRLTELAPWVFLHWRPQAEATRATVGGYTRLPGALGNKSLGGLKYVYKEG